MMRALLVAAALAGCLLLSVPVAQACTPAPPPRPLESFQSLTWLDPTVAYTDLGSISFRIDLVTGNTTAHPAPAAAASPDRMKSPDGRFQVRRETGPRMLSTCGDMITVGWSLWDVQDARALRTWGTAAAHATMDTPSFEGRVWGWDGHVAVLDRTSQRLSTVTWDQPPWTRDLPWPAGGLPREVAWQTVSDGRAFWKATSSNETVVLHPLSGTVERLPWPAAVTPHAWPTVVADGAGLLVDDGTTVAFASRSASGAWSWDWTAPGHDMDIRQATLHGILASNSTGAWVQDVAGNRTALPMARDEVIVRSQVDRLGNILVLTGTVNPGHAGSPGWGNGPPYYLPARAYLVDASLQDVSSVDLPLADAASLNQASADTGTTTSTSTTATTSGRPGDGLPDPDGGNATSSQDTGVGASGGQGNVAPAAGMLLVVAALALAARQRR